MAGIKISALPAIPSSALADLYPAVQGGVTYKATLTQLATLFGYSSGILLPASGGTGVSSPTAHTLPVAEGSSAFTFVGPLTNGQILIGSTGADPVPAALTAGTGITITNSAGGITISGSGSGYSWTEVTGTTQAMAVNNGYIANNVALVTLTLPAVATIGQTVILQGKGTGLFRIAQNASQTIHFGSSDTTTGVGGSLTATSRYDSIELLCITANTDWAVLTGTQGTFTVV